VQRFSLNLAQKLLTSCSTLTNTQKHIHTHTHGHTHSSDAISPSQLVARGDNKRFWDNTYFDLRLLLPNHQDEDFSVSVERGPSIFPFPLTNGHQPSLSLGPSIFRKPPQMPYIYSSICIWSATCIGTWWYYDKEFRKLRQTSALPWQEPLPELMMRANLQPTKSRQTNQPFLAKKHTSNYPNNKVKFCFSYNQGQPCRSDPSVCKHPANTVRSSILDLDAPNSPPMTTDPPQKNPNHSKAKNS
jgi:hypothetical protein